MDMKKRNFIKFFGTTVLLMNIIGLIYTQNSSLIFLKLKGTDEYKLIPTSETQNEENGSTLMCACPPTTVRRREIDTLKYKKLKSLDFAVLEGMNDDCRTKTCEEPVKSLFLQNDDIPCEDGGITAEMGFEVFLDASNAQRGWIELLSNMFGKKRYAVWFHLLSVCNHNRKETFYLKHRIKHPSLLTDTDDSQMENPDYEKYGGNLRVYKNLEQVYKVENQKNHFKTFFHIDDEKDINSLLNVQEFGSEDTKEYFVMKQLIEEDDMVNELWKDATYEYFNTGPMWYTIGNGSWKTINKFIRYQIKETLKDIVIYSGQSQEKLTIPKEKFRNLQNMVGISSTTSLEEESIKTVPSPLPDTKDVPITLNYDSITIVVPLFYFKIVYDQQLQLGIAIIMHNDLNFSKIPGYADRMVCIAFALCEEIGWTISQKNNTFGYTYCCQLTETVRKKLHVYNVISSDVDVLDLTTYSDTKLKNNQKQKPPRRVLSFPSARLISMEKERNN